MKSCLNATTLSQELAFDEFVRLAGQAGFAGVEVRLGPIAEMARERGIEGVRAFFADVGVAPAHCGLSASLTRPDADFSAALQNAPAECELARALGIPTAMIVLPFRRDAGESDPRRQVEKVRAVAEITGAYSLGLTLEFIGLHPPVERRGDFPTTLGRTLDLIDQVNRPGVGVLLDSYHWYLGGSRLADLARIPRGMPLFVHVNDAPPGPVATLTDPMRVLPGEGVLDLPAWLRAIREATGYDGYVSLELFNPEIRALDPAVAASRCATAVERVLGAVAAEG